MKEMKGDGEEIFMAQIQNTANILEPVGEFLAVPYCVLCVASCKAIKLEQNVIQVILTTQWVLLKVAPCTFSF